MGSVRTGVTKTKKRDKGIKRRKIVIKKKNITGTKLTKTKKKYLYKRKRFESGPTRTKTKTVSAKRAKRLGRRYSKKIK